MFMAYSRHLAVTRKTLSDHITYRETEDFAMSSGLFVVDKSMREILTS